MNFFIMSFQFTHHLIYWYIVNKYSAILQSTTKTAATCQFFCLTNNTDLKIKHQCQNAVAQIPNIKKAPSTSIFSSISYTGVFSVALGPDTGVGTCTWQTFDDHLNTTIKSRGQPTPIFNNVNMPALPYYTIPYLQDENIDIILFSDLAQIGQIHEIID